jgi:hypothetical protein
MRPDEHYLPDEGDPAAWFAATPRQEHDMTIPSSFGAMIESKYLKKEDVGDGTILTIAGYANENVAPENQPAEHKWVLTFEDHKKGMVLNTTNTQSLQELFGSSPSAAIGQQVMVYTDPNVSYGGRRMGGLRIKAATRRTVQPRSTSDDDINARLRAAEPDPFQ